jgi:hypothetical protein
MLDMDLVLQDYQLRRWLSVAAAMVATARRPSVQLQSTISSVLVQYLVSAHTAGKHTTAATTHTAHIMRCLHHDAAMRKDSRQITAGV